MLLRIFFCFYRQNSRRKAKDNWSLMMMRMLLITITIFNDINQQMSNVNVVESFSFFRCGPVSPSWIVLLITKFELLKCPGFIIFSRKMVKEYQSQPKSSSMIRLETWKTEIKHMTQKKIKKISNHSISQIHSFRLHEFPAENFESSWKQICVIVLIGTETSCWSFRMELRWWDVY